MNRPYHSEGKRKGAGGAGSCIRLSTLPEGVPARLCRHPDAVPLPRRLSDLGLVPDTPLMVVRRAPLGDPVELEIRGFRLCLRSRDLQQICVQPDPGPV